MAVATARIRLQTRGDGDVVDVTADVARAVADAGVAEGTCVVFVPGSTAAVTTVEFEPGMLADLRGVLERLIPTDAPYAHNHGGDSNGHAHVRAAIVGPSEAIPIERGRLALGTWQQIVLVDFDDRPRARDVIVQVIA